MPPMDSIQEQQSSSYSGATRSPASYSGEQDNNLHRVEFEAPLSAGSDAEQQHLQRAQRARFSIDYSLELERQLAMESPPQTPAKASTTFNQQSNNKELSPDPDVLAHIITQMRQSLEHITKEKDELVKMLAAAHTEHANTVDALQAMTDKATAVEEELTELKRKSKEDEDQIVLLRAKVEESRRGLMRLQTENRRQSMQPIDIARAGPGAFASFTSPASSKRASFVPLTGSMQGKTSGHRRNGSVNDVNLAALPSPDQTPSPNIRAFNIASAEAALSGTPHSSRRFSGLFGWQPSPAEAEMLQSGAIPAEISPNPNTFELEALRKELQRMKDELETVKHELGEANEAKEASETCVNALREFIAENNVGLVPQPAGLKLPPALAGEEADTKKTASGWGFKLWGNTSDSNPKQSGPQLASPASSAPIAPLPATGPLPAAVAPPPLARKLGGFFASRSNSSSNSHDGNQPQGLHLQTNAAITQLPSQRDSVYSHSDVSSIAEPISPGSDINGLGTAPYPQVKARGLHQDEAMVSDATSLEGSSARVSIAASELELLR